MVTSEAKGYGHNSNKLGKSSTYAWCLPSSLRIRSALHAAVHILSFLGVIFLPLSRPSILHLCCTWMREMHAVRDIVPYFSVQKYFWHLITVHDDHICSYFMLEEVHRKWAKIPQAAKQVRGQLWTNGTNYLEADQQKHTESGYLPQNLRQRHCHGTMDIFCKISSNFHVFPIIAHRPGKCEI